MLLAALVVLAAVAAFVVGAAIATRLARRRLSVHARRTAELHDELERRLVRLGVGLGIGA